MKFMTINQTAREVGVPNTFIRRLVKQKQISGFFNGGRFYVDVTAFREQIDRMCQENNKAAKI